MASSVLCSDTLLAEGPQALIIMIKTNSSIVPRNLRFISDHIFPFLQEQDCNEQNKDNKELDRPGFGDLCNISNTILFIYYSPCQVSIIFTNGKLSRRDCRSL